jgi:hypothetical protein
MIGEMTAVRPIASLAPWQLFERLRLLLPVPSSPAGKDSTSVKNAAIPRTGIHH